MLCFSVENYLKLLLEGCNGQWTQPFVALRKSSIPAGTLWQVKHSWQGGCFCFCFCSLIVLWVYHLFVSLLAFEASAEKSTGNFMVAPLCVTSHVTRHMLLPSVLSLVYSSFMIRYLGETFELNPFKDAWASCTWISRSPSRSGKSAVTVSLSKHHAPPSSLILRFSSHMFRSLGGIPQIMTFDCDLILEFYSTHLFCVCFGCRHLHAMPRVRRAEDSLQKQVLSFHHVSEASSPLFKSRALCLCGLFTYSPASVSHHFARIFEQRLLFCVGFWGVHFRLSGLCSEHFYQLRHFAGHTVI